MYSIDDLPSLKYKISINKINIKKKLPIAPKITTGYLARYAKLVTSADQGAILKT